MSFEGYSIRYFLGCNSPQGFVSRFDQLTDTSKFYRSFIIKGGPGTGKSTLMKKVAAHFLAKGENVEFIHCSSDPDSLDAVILQDLKLCIADGTAPHVIEPKYAGVVEQIVSLFDYIDGDKLQQFRDALIENTKQQKILHERASAFLSAAANLTNDTYRTALEFTDIQKIHKYAKSLASKEFKKQTAKTGSVEYIRFLSAVTPNGITMYSDAPIKLCSKIYVIDDEWGAAGRILLSALKEFAVNANLDIISCYCPLAPYNKLEHLIVPELGIAFITTNRFFNPELDYFRKIHATRFTDTDGLKSKKQRISFNRKAAAELISESVKSMAEAKQLHNLQEEMYANAIDFEGLTQFTQVLIDEFTKIAERLDHN